jgi:WhiB family transcriptional regulator, redox-sensing transcriptional regulator
VKFGPRRHHRRHHAGITAGIIERIISRSSGGHTVTDDPFGNPYASPDPGADYTDAVILDLASEPMEWQERALCAQTDPEAFFPEKGGSTREAKRVCLSCEVRVECLEYALENDERFGIWGGLSERERRRLKKQAV